MIFGANTMDHAAACFFFKSLEFEARGQQVCRRLLHLRLLRAQGTAAGPTQTCSALLLLRSQNEIAAGLWRPSCTSALASLGIPAPAWIRNARVLRCKGGTAGRNGGTFERKKTSRLILLRFFWPRHCAARAARSSEAHSHSSHSGSMWSRRCLLHVGQVSERLSQGSRQSLWKAWAIVVRVRSGTKRVTE